MSQHDRKVVVTGLGVISSAGFDAEEFYNNLCSGRDFTGPITSVDTSGFRRLNAAEIKRELPPLPEHWKDYSRASKMALTAAAQALTDAGLGFDLSNIKASISIGTMTGGAADFEKWYCGENCREPAQEQQALISQFPHHSAAASMAYEFRIMGCVNTTVSACASGTISQGIAYKLIKNGRADIVICGGVDAFRTLQHLESSAYRIVSPDKVKPFDAARKGILVGEGAGILIFEAEENAKRRNADIYCNVLGYGASCDAEDLAHPQENGEGIGKAMTGAIRCANIPAEKIGYINAHGTGTSKNDSAETAGIKLAFGKHAHELLASSIKGAIGHTLAAAGAVEAIAAVQTLKNGRIPPTINYNNLDVHCNLDIVPNISAEMRLEAVMSNSFGFGGNNASILFGAYENG